MDLLQMNFSRKRSGYRKVALGVQNRNISEMAEDIERKLLLTAYIKLYTTNTSYRLVPICMTLKLTKRDSKSLYDKWKL